MSNNLTQKPYPPKEVIVVEGRDDTKRLIETFGKQVKTIETNGSAVSRKVLKQIVALADTFGIIVFTDPDYQGDRIRRIVSKAVPNAKQAHLAPEKAKAERTGASLGIEHATPADIIQALEHVMTPDTESQTPIIPLSQLMSLHLVGHPNAKENRAAIAQHFNLGHLNGKALQQQLVRYNISLQDLKNFINNSKGGNAT